MTSRELSVTVAINSWKLVVDRLDRTFSRLSEDQFSQEVAPGKNRIIYLLGHLTAINDAMFQIIGLGARLHSELDAMFVSTPDKSAQLPAVQELKQYWSEVNSKLLLEFRNLAAEEWLLRHYAMSEDDYAKEPTRNRLAVLLSRTNHIFYHLGQINLAMP